MTKNKLQKWLGDECVYVPYVDFFEKKEILQKKYNVDIIAWTYDPDYQNEVEYRNVNSFYGRIMQKNNGNLFLSGDENRTADQDYFDKILKLKL